MIDEQLGEIRARLHEMLAVHDGEFCQDCDDIIALLAEVDWQDKIIAERDAEILRQRDQMEELLGKLTTIAGEMERQGL